MTSNSMKSKRRNLSEAAEETTAKKPKGREDRFYLEKLSSEDVAKLVMSTSPESSSIGSDEEIDCWAVSKSPLKKPEQNRLKRSEVTNPSDALVVSPVKLKRKPEVNKKKNISVTLQQDESKLNQIKIKVGEEIEKEILAQIQNSPGLNRKSKLAFNDESHNISISSSDDTLGKVILNPSASSPKETNLKKKLTDSDSDVSAVALENINCVNGLLKKSPKKRIKIKESSKDLEVILKKLTPEYARKFGCILANGKIGPEIKTPTKSSQEVKYSKDCDLAVPLDSLDNNNFPKSEHLAKSNEMLECNSLKSIKIKDKIKSKCSKSESAKLLEVDKEDVLKTSLRTPNLKQTDSDRPETMRQSLRIQKSLSLLKKLKNKSKNSRQVTKNVNYKEDSGDESSDSSAVSSDTSEKVTARSSCSTPNKTNIKQTPNFKTGRNRTKYEMDEGSSESSEISEDSDSGCDQIPRVSRNGTSTKDLRSSAVKNRNTSKLDSKSSSPVVLSPRKTNLRKRSEKKQLLSDDFVFYDKNFKKTTSSPKTPVKNGKENREVECDTTSENPTEQSPRFSRRILEKASAKKASKTNEHPSFESLHTPPRSTKKGHNLSPLVNSTERISLRNRSEIKKPWGDDFETDFGKRVSNINSPKTPTQCLRKQALEYTTRSAKKKLVMGSESSSDDEDIIPLKRTPNKRAVNSSKKTPVKTAKESPLKTTPVKSTPRKKNEPSTPCTPRTVRRVGQGFLTPVVEERSISRHSLSALEDLRVKLHLSTVPSSLPCRSNESKNIKSFISSKIKDKTGGCMYISGVPGTGKTATVHAVVKALQQNAIDSKITPFDFVEVNSLRLSEARQAYVRIWQSLSGSKVSAEQALHSLGKKFSGKPSRPTVLLIDELDYVCNRRQDVVYNVLEWCTKKNSRLIVLTIANTMDLPERTLKGRVTSRMGLTRLVFQPYTYQQLQEIVMNRIHGSSSFDPDAVQFVARKVAAVSGDARRALDICRRSTELLEDAKEKVTLAHVNKTLSQIYLTRRVQAIKHCSSMSKFLLRSIRDETLRTGIEETTVREVFSHLCSLCNLEGFRPPTLGQVLTLCRTLSSSSLISLEKGRHDILSKITLNVSSDDIHFALSC